MIGDHRFAEFFVAVVAEFFAKAVDGGTAGVRGVHDVLHGILMQRVEMRFDVRDNVPFAFGEVIAGFLQALRPFERVHSILLVFYHRLLNVAS